MTTSDTDPVGAKLDFAKKLALTAGELTKARFGQAVIDLKDDRSLVTDADHAAQELILDRLADAFPEDAVLAEDLARLEEEVYRGPLPEADAGFLGLLFESAEQFEVTIEVEELNIEGDEAVARIRQAMAYQLSVTHETRDHELRLDMVFQRTNSDWRLVRLEPR